MRGSSISSTTTPLTILADCAMDCNGSNNAAIVRNMKYNLFIIKIIFKVNLEPQRTVNKMDYSPG